MRFDAGENGVAQLRQAGVRAALQRLGGEQAEEALHDVELGRVGRREMQMRARVTQQPPMDEKRFVRRQVVEHAVNLLHRIDTRVDGAEERDEIGRAMASRARRENLTGRHVQGGEESRVPWRR